MCQRLSKIGERVKAPLISIPLIDELWRRIAIDVVGPIQKCKVSSYRFLVTIIDLDLHFSLAYHYPVREHTAVEVSKCLIDALSIFEFPREILSDQGTYIVSQIMEVF